MRSQKRILAISTVQDSNTGSNYMCEAPYQMCDLCHLRIEVQIFSLHWMIQNIRLFMSVKPKGGLLRDIKKTNVFLHYPVQAKHLNFNPYIYILYYQSNMPYNLTPSPAQCYPFRINYFICNGGVGAACRQNSCT